MIEQHVAGTDPPAWAAGAPFIGTAAAALKAASLREPEALSGPSAKAVTAWIASWDGNDPGIGPWVVEATDGVPDADQPAARLALLAGIAPYRITDDHVASFRRTHPDDSDLVRLLAWVPCSPCSASRTGSLIRRSMLIWEGATPAAIRTPATVCEFSTWLPARAVEPCGRRHGPADLVNAVDLPRVIAETQQAVKGRGAESRYRFLAGDAFSVNLGGTYDLALVGNFCHLFGPERNLLLLRRLREALVPGGHVAIIDVVPPSGRQSPPQLALYELSLVLCTTSGAVHHFSAYVDWLIRSGYRSIERVDVDHVTGLTPR